jgi:nitric oxide reductase NorF protein
MTRRQQEDLLGVLAMLITFAIGAAIVALAIAFAKGRLVILDFLELRGGAHAMRLALIAWPALLLTAACARSLTVALLE